jgi:hypothetical protein
VAIGVEIRCGPLAGHPAPGEEVGFADDSPVEGDGFEPSVPRSRERTSDAKSDLQEDNRRRSIRQAE